MALMDVRRWKVLYCILLSASAFAQSGKPFKFADTSLFTPYQKFKAAHPNAKCQPLGMDKSCRVNNMAVGGVQPSRMNFNFERGVLTNIAITFYPAPTADQVQQILTALSSQYGRPKAAAGYKGQVIYRWTTGKTAMSLFIPTSADDQALIVVDIPSQRD